jgi:hypothetical protein
VGVIVSTRVLITLHKRSVACMPQQAAPPSSHDTCTQGCKTPLCVTVAGRVSSHPSPSAATTWCVEGQPSAQLGVGWGYTLCNLLCLQSGPFPALFLAFMSCQLRRLDFTFNNLVGHDDGWRLL